SYQAGDRLRSFHVTGVQTCALPILQPALARLDPEQGQHAGVLVRTDALLRLRIRLAGVAHDLDERRRIAEVRLEVGLLGAQRECPGAQELAGDTAEVLVPLGDNFAQLRLGRRPQVRADQPVEGRSAVDGIPLGTDVDLFAPVDLALSALAPDAGVSAEVRAVHVLDGELVFFGQR